MALPPRRRILVSAAVLLAGIGVLVGWLMLRPRADGDGGSARVLTFETEVATATPNETVDRFAAPLEEELSKLRGIAHIESRSSSGRYHLDLFLESGFKFDDARIGVEAVLRKALPDARLRTRSEPLLFLTVQTQLAGAGRPVPPSRLRSLLEAIPGVGEVFILGLERPEAFRVDCDHARLQARNLTMVEVYDLLDAAQTRGLPGGNAADPAQDILNLSIRRNQQEEAILLRDVARIEHMPGTVDHVRIDVAGRIIYGLTPKVTANPLELAESVRKSLPLIRQQIPGIEIRVTMDLSRHVQGGLRKPDSAIVLLTLAQVDGASPALIERELDRVTSIVLEEPGVRGAIPSRVHPLEPLLTAPVVLAELDAELSGEEWLQKMQNRLRDRELQWSGRVIEFREGRIQWRDPVAWWLSGANHQEVRDFAHKLAERFPKETKWKTAAIGRGLYGPLVEWEVDKAKTDRLGIDKRSVEKAIAAMRGVSFQLPRGDKSGTIRVLLQAREWLRDIEDIPISTAGGKAIWVKDVARAMAEVGPSIRYRADLKAVIPFSGSPSVGVSRDEALRDAERIFTEVRDQMPGGAHLGWFRSAESR